MRLHILGGLELSAPAGGQSADVTKQTRLILACLALAGTKGLTRGQLCGLFWPDRPTPQARNSLRQSLAAIRKALSGDAGSMSLHTDLEVVRLEARTSSVDVEVFRLGVEQDDRNARISAAHAFRGELLAGVEAPDDVEQYVAPYRQSLNDQAQRLAERLSMSVAADGEALEAAQGLADRLLRIDPASEEAHRALMRIYLRHGRTNAALRQFEHFKAVLRHELQAEPEAETLQLHASIQSGGVDAPGKAERTEESGQTAAAVDSDQPTKRPAMYGVPSHNLGDRRVEHEPSGDVVSAASAAEGPAQAPMPHWEPGGDFRTTAAAGAPHPFASVGPTLAATSAATELSRRPAWLARLDLSWRNARNKVVAGLVLLSLGGLLLPRGRAVPEPFAQLTMQAVPTVAVLPFKASEHPATDNAAAFGEEVRSELGRSIRYLDLVITSSTHAEAEAGQLSERYIVAGTILGGSRERKSTVTVNLTEAGTGKLLWSESIGLKPGDGPALNRTAARLARALAIQIRTAESRRPLPPQPEAGHYAMMGHALGQDKNTAATVGEALSLFQKAIAIDANSSSALHGVAWARLVQVMNSYVPESEHAAAIAEAKAAIDCLLARDPRNPATHFLRGNMFRARKEVAEAIAAYEYTLSLNPNHQWAHASLGRMMIEVGLAREAIGKIELAMRLHPSDPLNHAVFHWAGVAALHAGDDRAAVDWLLKARLANAHYPSAMLWLAIAYCAVGDMVKARANLAEYAAIRPGVSIKSFRRSQATTNPLVAEQRERLVALLRKLGVTEDRSAAAPK